MSRLSRTDSAKSVIDVWRWLHEQSSDREVEGGIPALHERLGDVGHVSNTSGLTDRIRLMEHLGLIKRDSEYVGQRQEDGSPTFPKQTVTTTLLLDLDEGRKRIARHFAQGGFLKLSAKGNQKLTNGSEALPRGGGRAIVGDEPVPGDFNDQVVAIRTDEQDRPVEAVVGEEPPTLGEALAVSQPEVAETLRSLRKSEPAALVEAARQYANRQDFVLARLDEIERLGVKLDKAKIMSGIDMGRDDELEGIVKILPYISDLEAQVGQVGQWRGDVLAVREEMKELQRAKQKVERELAEQKAANARLAEKMARDIVTRPQVLVGG